MDSLYEVCTDPDTGVRYLEANWYLKVGNAFAVHPQLRRFWDAPPDPIYAAPPAVRAQLASSEHDPFHCATCGQPLTQWARERGFRHCSRTCRTAS